MDDEERVRLEVAGITYSQVQPGAYALVLSQVDGDYRIPIIVGIAEAQAIAVKLEGIIPPRPMPHDLFVSMAHAFGIQLEEVFISNFDDGVFMSELRFANGQTEVVLDSRTSDAIALALRTNAPIYTTRVILEKTGFVMKGKGTAVKGESDIDADDANDIYSRMSVERLEELMQSYVEREEYEMAAEVKKAIEKKRTEETK